MEFYEVIKTRRSIRSYKNTSIPEESIKRVSEAARIAPAGIIDSSGRSIL